MSLPEYIIPKKKPCYHYSRVQRSYRDTITGKPLAFNFKFDYCNLKNMKINLKQCKYCKYYEPR